jgi:hypothetical protein
MNELAVQNKIKAAVVEAGGAAHKLSTPFKIGICDLLIKLPSTPAVLAEVKLAKFKNPQISPNRTFKLDVTHNQMAFLDQFEAAGMTCRVISAVQLGIKLYLCMLTLDTVRASAYTVHVSAHLFPSHQITRMIETGCHGK